jgi:hypothetical protein
MIFEGKKQWKCNTATYILSLQMFFYYKLLVPVDQFKQAEDIGDGGFKYTKKCILILK